jgi:hypothetical protein
MPARLGSVSAIDHAAPTPSLGAALIDEQPAATPVVLTLANRLDPGHQFAGGERERALIRRPKNRAD